MTPDIALNFNSNDELAKTWMSRIKKNTEKYFDPWSNKFRCDVMEKYYQGEQWTLYNSTYEPYVTNLVFSTIETKVPSLFFQTPSYSVRPKPTQVEYDYEMAIKRALLREDVLNTLASDHIQDVAAQVELSILDAFFRFGAVEIGFSADWIENPHADMPILRSDNETPFFDEDNNIIKQPKKLPVNERIYLKRIIAKRFRVSGLQVGPKLEQANWVGYWDYVRMEDVKANPNLKNLDKIDWPSGRSTDYPEDEEHKSGDLLKIWKIWDNRAKKKYLFDETHTLTLLEQKFNRLPIIGLRFNPLLEGWLPMPPAYNWKSPQDEYNDSREQARNHRKRFNRKYIYRIQEFEEDELDKLLNGGDGTFVKVNNDLANAVAPVQNADLGQASVEGMTVTKDDFNIVSGTSSEQRLQANRTTATQAEIVNQNATIRDSKARLQVATFLSDIGREILLQAEENFTAPIWVKMAIPQGPQPGSDPGQEIPFVWAQVKMSDLNEGETGDSLNFSVSVSVDSISPIENKQAQQSYLLFISLIQQYPELAQDPLLVRETAYAVGYRNEQVIRRMQKFAEATLVAKMQAIQNATQQSQANQPGTSPLPGQNNMGSQLINQNMPAVANQVPQVLSGNIQ